MLNLDQVQRERMAPDQLDAMLLTEAGDPTLKGVLDS
jgi:hypothetical protein